MDRLEATINWPNVLQAYPDKCPQLAELYRSFLAGRDRAAAVELTRQIELPRGTVRADIAHYSASDYYAAQKFLCGLKVEITTPATPLATLSSYSR